MKMSEDRNQFQITRKDAKNCFVESLSDAFSIGKVHFNFASYDLTKPAGNRQTDMVAIYLDADEFLELCRKLSCGEFRYMVQNKKQSGDRTYLFQSLGGTSAEKLKAQGRARPDGKSLSRTLQILVGNKTDLLLVADSGPGETNEKGLIVPKFGNKPENHVTVSMTLDTFGELMLLTKVHYEAWLTAWYSTKMLRPQGNAPQREQKRQQTAPRDNPPAVSNQFF